MKRRCRLINAPTGLFIFNDTIAMKTEYMREDGRVAAYIVSTGEVFCAGSTASTVEEFNNLMVCPIKYDELRNFLNI